jgi:regulatory protein
MYGDTKGKRPAVLFIVIKGTPCTATPTKGIDRESAASAAEHLETLGLINEEADVERLVSSCLAKLWGKKRIYRELCAKGYDKSIVSEELSKIEQDTLVENCVALFRKKHKVFPNDPETQKKIIASLVRYGYSFDEIKRAIQMIEKIKNPRA